ncbi:hypothetical protein [Arthrobacter sp. 31Y]|uniref:hypothetical protein n=1 Tax=Arthrobacter sp. 31Y TaxID=1115632 RepID=UPI0004633FF7|nr:hypothetical protein [Arthrobacter sp. 31Y]
MARHRATPPPSAFKRKAGLSLAVLAGAPLLALGPVSAATAADTTSPPAVVQEQTTVAATAPVTVADVSAKALAETAPARTPLEDAPVKPALIDPAPVPEEPVPVDPAPVPVDPIPVDPVPTPVDPTPVDPIPTPVPVDPTPVPVDPTPVPVVPEPVQPAPVQQAPVQQAPVQQAPVQQAPVQQAPVAAAPVTGVAPVNTVQPQLAAGQARGTAVGAVPGSRAAVAQTVPVQQLANTGASGTDQAVAGLGLGLVLAGSAAVALGRRSHGRKAARA